MVARLASIANGTKRLQVRVLRWSFFLVSFNEMLIYFSDAYRTSYKLIPVIRVIIQ